MASPMAFDEIKTLPKSKSLLGHVGASGLNALGGFMAGRVRGQIATAFPDWKGAGTIGVFCFAVGLRSAEKSSEKLRWFSLQGEGVLRCRLLAAAKNS